LPYWNKVGALDQAAPLANWDLPEKFTTLRRVVEAWMIKAGWREYVQIFGLLETFEMEGPHVAIKNAIRMEARDERRYLRPQKQMVIHRVLDHPNFGGLTSGRRSIQLSA
jgi:hypothetical protein